MSVSNNSEVEMEIHVVNLTGPLNERQFEDVTRLFKDLAEQDVKRVVVNLAEVPLIDSRGLAALVVGYKTFGREPQNFRLVALQDQPRLVFELTGFDQIFQIYDSLATAAEIEPHLELEFSQGILVSVPHPAPLDLLA